MHGSLDRKKSGEEMEKKRRGKLDHKFTADSREFRAVLEGVPLSTPDVQAFIRYYIRENTEEISGGAYE